MRQRWPAGPAAGLAVEAVAVPGADHGAALERRLVERAAEMRAHERMREEAALVLDHAEALARDVHPQRQPRAERRGRSERERRARAGLRGRRAAAGEQRLAAHHHPLVLIPQPRVEADVALAERLPRALGQAGHVEGHGHVGVRRVRRGEARHDVGPGARAGHGARVVLARVAVDAHLDRERRRLLPRRQLDACAPAPRAASSSAMPQNES